MGLVFEKGATIVMIGDSITDAGRRQIELGQGYVFIIASLLAERYPSLGLKVVNMGISGNTVKDLEARWEKDVIKQQPSWVSVSIGVNDVWRQLDSKGEGAVMVGEYEQVYRRLLTKTEEAGSKMILMETTVIGESATDEGNKKLKPYNAVIGKLAKEFGAILVKENCLWHKAIRENPGVKWTLDGVHPTPGGHGLMAKIWLDAVGYEW